MTLSFQLPCDRSVSTTLSTALHVLCNPRPFIAWQYVNSVEWNIFYSKHIVKEQNKLLNPSCQKKIKYMACVVYGTTHKTSNNLTFAGQVDVFNFCISCFFIYCSNITAVYFQRWYVGKDVVIWCRHSSLILLIS